MNCIRIAEKSLDFLQLAKLGRLMSGCVRAYMETDYSKLKVSDFVNTLNGYFSYLVSIGKLFDEKFVPSPQYVMDYFNFILLHKKSNK